ncbi:hypothetical protein RhiirA4_492419 [Rhizophagus irregularis]|uniref:Uncharacterized protein n=1 Tax=Rhizophagus irregularis TaxID=588596 RepID=A0A2I1HX76_9GLOM|nr:hypothetical protein RhiirA4_492419 [Rhizophagus irregularis]
MTGCNVALFLVVIPLPDLLSLAFSNSSFTNFCLELCDGVSRPVPLAFPLPLLDFQTHKAKESALVSGEGEQVDAMIKEVTATL